MNLIKMEREWVGKYIHHRNLLNKGRGEFSWFTDLLKIGGIPLGIAFAEIIRQGWVIVVILSLAYLGLCYFVGWWWETRHHFDLESEWGNKRNPTLQHIYEKVK